MTTLMRGHTTPIMGIVKQDRGTTTAGAATIGECDTTAAAGQRAIEPARGVGGARWTEKTAADKAGDRKMEKALPRAASFPDYEGSERRLRGVDGDRRGDEESPFQFQ
jgi:hypothetical protein